jgi:poly(hydroxyalkanoate) granule-associated protein
MVKKLKAMADKKKRSRRGLFDSALASSVKESAQQIWLAGMGAFAKAQAEGRQVFDALVKEGTTLQKKTQSAAEEKFGDVSSKMSSMAEDVTAKAGKQWDKLESIFEERTAKAMKKLGVPSSKDVEALMARIDALSAQVARSAGRRRRRPPPARRPRPQGRQEGGAQERGLTAAANEGGRRGVLFSFPRQRVNWPGKNQIRLAVITK